MCAYKRREKLEERQPKYSLPTMKHPGRGVRTVKCYSIQDGGNAEQGGVKIEETDIASLKNTCVELLGGEMAEGSTF